MLSTAITILIGVALGLGGLFLGLRFHIGPWFFDGVWGTAGAAVSGALVALVVRYALRKEFGWPW